MKKRARLLVAFGCVLVLAPHARTSAQTVSPKRLIEDALAGSSLVRTTQPFHAVLQIGNGPGDYTGSVELWWQSATHYRVQVHSPAFSQTRVVNGNEVEEENAGDYYPRWLQNFTDALLDPIPRPQQFESGSLGARMEGENICLVRDDRPGGITDNLTWGHLCLAEKGKALESLLTMNENMEYSDWKTFHGQRIARKYQTDVEGYEPVPARLSKLEEWAPDQTMLAVTKPTPMQDQIRTGFVSTQQEEALLEHAPTIEWPSVREGKTEGYMIVYARTDRTGQVRETSKHNSDQPGLEDFGMQQALKYKFKPLIVDGAPEQMEMPLVLHFNSHTADPLPILTLDEMRKQAGSCSLPQSVGGINGAGPDSVVVELSIDETGKLGGFRPLTSPVNPGWIKAMAPLEKCRFAPLLRNGVATYYKGDVTVAY